MEQIFLNLNRKGLIILFYKNPGPETGEFRGGDKLE